MDKYCWQFIRILLLQMKCPKNQENLKFRSLYNFNIFEFTFYKMLILIIFICIMYKIKHCHLYLITHSQFLKSISIYKRYLPIRIFVNLSLWPTKKQNTFHPSIRKSWAHHWFFWIVNKINYQVIYVITA